MGKLNTEAFGENKVGMHWIVLEKEWTEDSARRAADRAAFMGFDFLEVPPMDPGSEVAKATKQAFADAGIGATMSLGLSVEQDLTSLDQADRDRGEAFLSGLLDTCAEIGAASINGITYTAFQKYDAPCPPEGRAAAVDVLQRLGDKAQKLDLTIGLEVVNRYETYLLNTAAQAVAMARDIASPAINVHLDTYHMNIEESDLERAIVDTGSHLGFFHVGESHRGYLGTGSVDFVQTFRGLAKANYGGPISFESFSSAKVGQPLLGILGIWRDTWSDGDDLAKHSLDFMRSYIASAVKGRAFS